MGSELDHIVYDSFGNIVTETDPAEGDRFTFAGMQFDATIGLFYDHARVYDATDGKFLAQDPIGFASGVLPQFLCGQLSDRCYRHDRRRRATARPPQPSKHYVDRMFAAQQLWRDYNRRSSKCSDWLRN